MRYILSSAVITSPGIYDYSVIPIELARDWIRQGPFAARIGYQETAIAFDRLFDIYPGVNREALVMLRGDEALVFRLVFPPGTPTLKVENKGKIDPNFILKHCEIGLLKKKT